MKRNKKILSVLFILIVVVASVGILTACGNNLKPQDYNDLGKVSNNSTVIKGSIGGKKTTTINSRFLFVGHTGYYYLSNLKTNDNTTDTILGSVKLNSADFYTNAAPSGATRAVTINSRKCYYLENGKTYYCQTSIQNQSKKTAKIYVQLIKHTDVKSINKTKNATYKPSVMWKDTEFMYNATKGGVLTETELKIWLNRNDLKYMLNTYKFLWMIKKDNGTGYKNLDSMVDAIKTITSDASSELKSAAAAKIKTCLVNTALSYATGSVAKQFNKLKEIIKGIPCKAIANALVATTIGAKLTEAKSILKAKFVANGISILNMLSNDSKVLEYKNGVLINVTRTYSTTTVYNSYNQNTNEFNKATYNTITQKISYESWNDDWGKTTKSKHYGEEYQVGTFYYWGSNNCQKAYGDWAKEHTYDISVNGNTIVSFLG